MAKKAEEKTKKVTIELPISLIDKVNREAKATMRSIKAVHIIALQEHFDNKGGKEE